MKMKLEIGKPAPDFRADDQNKKSHSLKEYLDHWLVLYFYPKDFTSGCTVEAEQFRDAFNDLKDRAVIVGVSADTAGSHKLFCDKYKLQFTLLSDPEKKIIQDYGADGIIFARRVSFLIDPKGIIRKIYNKVNPEIHASEILIDLRAMER